MEALEKTTYQWSQELGGQLPPYNTRLNRVKKATPYVDEEVFSHQLDETQKAAVVGLAYVHWLNKKEGYLLQCLFPQAGQSQANVFPLNDPACEGLDLVHYRLTTTLKDNLTLFSFPDSIERVELEISGNPNQILVWSARDNPSTSSIDDHLDLIRELNMQLIFAVFDEAPKPEQYEACRPGGLYTYHNQRGTLLQGSRPDQEPPLASPPNGPTARRIPSAFTEDEEVYRPEYTGSMRRVDALRAVLAANPASGSASQSLDDEAIAKIRATLESEDEVDLRRAEGGQFEVRIGTSRIINFPQSSVRRLLSCLRENVSSPEARGIIESLQGAVSHEPASDEPSPDVSAVMKELEKAILFGSPEAANASDSRTVGLTGQETLRLHKLLARNSSRSSASASSPSAPPSRRPPPPPLPSGSPTSSSSVEPSRRPLPPTPPSNTLLYVSLALLAIGITGSLWENYRYGWLKNASILKMPPVGA